MARRKIELQILGDEKSLQRALSRSSKDVQKFGIGVGTIAKSAVVFEGVRRGIDALSGGIRSGIAEWSEQVKVAAQTNAVLKSTRGIANVTGRGLDRLAGRVARLSGIDDELIKQGGNLLLTFKNVRNEVGKGNKIFDRATKAAVDLSVAGFGAIESTAKQLGKALNDPVRGMAALGRAGVTFTKSQRDTIKALVESGRVLEAQKLILREVESQVGGSAKAFGETLPGQLSRMRESLKNTFGDLVGLVVPSLTSVVDRVNEFIDDLGRARTVRAKLDVVWEGVQEAGRGATAALSDAIAQIDWDAVWSQARGIADGLQDRLEKIDWGVVGKKIGDGIAEATRRAIPAAKELAERVNLAVRSIDFEQLGKQLGPGLAAALVTAFTTLSDPAFWVRNWDLTIAVALSVFRVRIVTFAGKLAAPLRGVGQDLVLRIGVGMLDVAPRLAGILFRVLSPLTGVAARALAPLVGLVTRTFGRLGRIAQFTVRILGLQAAVNAVAGFGRRVGEVLSDAWRGIEKRALEAVLKIIEPFSHLPERLGGGPFQDLKEIFEKRLASMEASAAKTASTIEGYFAGIKAFRDAEIASRAAEKATGGQKRGPAKQPPKTPPVVAATADQTAKAAESAAEKARAAFERVLGGLQLAFERAQLTPRLRDDLVAVKAIIAALRERSAVTKNDLELQQQLVSAQSQQLAIQKQITEQAAARRTARQFRSLGLGPTGEERIPGVAALKRQLGNLDQAIKGTFLDKQKTRSLLGSIRRLLSGQLGALSDEVRAKIKQLLDGVKAELREGAKAGPQTPFQKRGIENLVAGIAGLTPEQIKELRQRFSQFGAADLKPGRGGTRLAAATAGFGGGLGQALIVHTHVHLDGQEIATSTTRHQQKGRGRRGGSRRGTPAGINR